MKSLETKLTDEIDVPLLVEQATGVPASLTEKLKDCARGLWDEIKDMGSYTDAPEP